MSADGYRVDVTPGDVIEAPIGARRPTTHHPEDVLLDGPITRIGELSPVEMIDFLGDMCESDVPLLGCHEDRIAVSDIPDRQNHASLQVIHSPETSFYWKQSFRGDRQLRAEVYTGQRWLDLSVTDPRVERALGGHANVVYEDVLLTISLAEPFIPAGADQPYCFKVIAGARQIR